jgi:hypothetical protein
LKKGLKNMFGSLLKKRNDLPTNKSIKTNRGHYSPGLLINESDLLNNPRNNRRSLCLPVGADSYYLKHILNPRLQVGKCIRGFGNKLLNPFGIVTNCTD